VRFSELIVTGLAEAESVSWTGDQSQVFTTELPYPIAVPASEMAKMADKVKLSKKGKALVKAWKQGDLKKLTSSLSNQGNDL
jgi:hypothetical protein